MKQSLRYVLIAVVLVSYTVLVGCSGGEAKDSLLRQTGSALADSSSAAGSPLSLLGNQPDGTVPRASTNTEGVVDLTVPGDLTQRPGFNGETDAVVFVHGWNSTSAVWDELRAFLAQRGISRHCAIDLPERGLLRPIPDFATEIGEAIESLRRQGVSRVHLIGHSMGGLVCREYLRRQNGSGRVPVPNLITIATPNNGTNLFTQEEFEIIDGSPRMQMNPSSDFLARLNGAGAPFDTRVTCFWTPNDEVVIPAQSSTLPWAHNVAIEGLGNSPHSKIVCDGRLCEQVAALLQGTAS